MRKTQTQALRRRHHLVSKQGIDCTFRTSACPRFLSGEDRPWGMESNPVDHIGPHLLCYGEMPYPRLLERTFTEENPQQLWFWSGQHKYSCGLWQVENSEAELDFLGFCWGLWLVGIIHCSQSMWSYYLPVHSVRWWVTSLPVKNC